MPIAAVRGTRGNEVCVVEQLILRRLHGGVGARLFENASKGFVTIESAVFVLNPRKPGSQRSGEFRVRALAVGIEEREKRPTAKRGLASAIRQMPCVSGKDGQRGIVAAILPVSNMLTIALIVCFCRSVMRPLLLA